MTTRKTETSGLLEHIDAFPPFFYYYTARNSKAKYDHPNYEELSRRTSDYGYRLSPKTIERLSQKISWADVTVAAMDAYCAACRFQFVRINKCKGGFIGPSNRGRMNLVRVHIASPFRNHMAYFRATLRRKSHEGSMPALRSIQRKRFDLLCVRWLVFREQAAKLESGAPVQK